MFPFSSCHRVTSILGSLFFKHSKPSHQCRHATRANNRMRVLLLVHVCPPKVQVAARDCHCWDAVLRLRKKERNARFSSSSIPWTAIEEGKRLKTKLWKARSIEPSPSGLCLELRSCSCQQTLFGCRKTRQHTCWTKGTRSS